MHTVTSKGEQTHSPTIGHITRVKQSFGYSADQKRHNTTEYFQSRLSKESTSNKIYFALHKTYGQ